jgi:polysaccharide export outer membrane protein
MSSMFRRCATRFSELSFFLVTLCLFAAVVPLRGQQKVVARDTGKDAAAGGPARGSQLAVRNGLNEPELQHRDSRYRICASDVLGVSFPLTPEFDQTISIQPDGFASLAAAGDVRLAGLTTEESVQTIRAAYSKVLHDPIVTVALKKFNEPYFIVGGQVRQPGKYDLRGYTTATQAIAMAGGFNNDAKHSQVLLFRRVNNDWFEVKDLNLKRILRGKDLAEDPEIRTGDMLFVPQNAISKIKRLIPAYGVGTYYQLYR